MKRRYRVLIAVALATVAYFARPRHAGEDGAEQPRRPE